MANMYLEKVYFYQSFRKYKIGRKINTMRYHFIPSRIAMIKKMESKSQSGIWRNVASVAGRNEKWASTCENSVVGSLSES